MLKNLLLKQFVSHYNITARELSVDACLINDNEFDLDDMDSPITILPFGDGKLSFKNDGERLEVIHYEDFINQCKKPLSFQNGQKRCDYIVSTSEETEDRSHFILAELTSALGGVSNLSKPIFSHDKVTFAGGKYEKAEMQLSGSLTSLENVPEIRDYINHKKDKQCIMAYKIIAYDDPIKRIQHPMNRYLQIESEETHNNGAVILSPIINSFGFTYRRISHAAYYQL